MNNDNARFVFNLTVFGHRRGNVLHVAGGELSWGIKYAVGEMSDTHAHATVGRPFVGPPLADKGRFTTTMGGLHATFTPHETKLTARLRAVDQKWTCSCISATSACPITRPPPLELGATVNLVDQRRSDLSRSGRPHLPS